MDRNLPVINIGTTLKPVYMPAELVEVIPGQPLKRKTNPAETAQMILSACRSPFANAMSLTTIGRACLNLDQNSKLVGDLIELLLVEMLIVLRLSSAYPLTGSF